MLKFYKKIAYILVYNIVAANKYVRKDNHQATFPFHRSP